MSVTVIADPGATWRIPGEPIARSWRRMCQLMDATKAAGAQVFKPQCYTADLYPCDTAEWRLLSRYELPREWLPRLKDECDRRELEFMCSVYRPEDVPLVDPLVGRWKVASFENQHEQLLRAIHCTRKPVLVSTGGVRIDGARSWRLTEPWGRATLLHCVSAYPAAAEAMNLRVLFQWNYACEDGVGSWETYAPMGLSDHAIGTTAAVIAVAYGASVVEKHIRAGDTPASNPDWPASLSPAGFKDYVAAIREAESMLGDGVKRVMPGEEIARRYDPRTGRRGTKGETKP